MLVPIAAVPYVRLVRRLFLGRGTLQSIAHRQEILCPEEKMTLRPSIFLPGQIERIAEFKSTDTWIHTTKQIEISAAVSTSVTHAPTISYHIEDAVLFDGSIYSGHYKHSIADKAMYVSTSHEVHHIKTAGLASSYLGTKYFGHWLLDDCTKYLLAEQVGSPLCLRMPAYSHQQQYQAYFGQDWTPIDRAHIDHLVVFQDFSQNSLKRNRYRILRDRIKRHFPSSSGKKCIYLKRGQTGTPRLIQNEDEIIEALVKRNFVVADIGVDSLSEIIKVLRDAKIVVSIEGSHNDHCALASPENSALLVLQPADRFAAFQRHWSECLDIRYGFVVGAVRDSGYYFSVSEILLTIDLMLNKLAV
jgi:hypothetical protein